MTKYEESKWFCENELIEVAHRMRIMEEEMDKVYKASMYLIGKYKKELIDEFKVKVTPKEDFSKCKIFGKSPNGFSDTLYDFYVEGKVFDIISEEMKKKYPDPWYSYGRLDFSEVEK